MTAAWWFVIACLATGAVLMILATAIATFGPILRRRIYGKEG